MSAYDAYIRRNNRLLAKGKATTDAIDFYRRYSADWMAAWDSLGQLADNNVTVTGPTTVNWVRPVKVTLGVGRTTVLMRRCLDTSKVVVTQNGRPLDQPHLEKPHVYRVRMEKSAEENWWRASAAEQGPPC